MADIELIPSDYAAVRRLRKLLMRLAMLIALVIVATAGVRGWLAWRIAAERPAVAALTRSGQSADQRRARLLALQLRKTQTDARQAALGALRDGDAWQTIFRAIDAVNDPGLWLEALSYTREVRFEPAPLPATGTKPAPAPNVGPEMRYDVEIQGHATAHATVTTFVRALGEQPGVGTLRLGETSMRPAGPADVIDFKLSGSLQRLPKAAP